MRTRRTVAARPEVRMSKAAQQRRENPAPASAARAQAGAAAAPERRKSGDVALGGTPEQGEALASAVDRVHAGIAAAGPRMFEVPAPGRWAIIVEGLDAKFEQAIAVGGDVETAHDPEAPVSAGQVVRVNAKGPWSLSVHHRVSEADAAWAKKPPDTWLPSAHKGALIEKDQAFEVATEDFSDGDFNDLVLSGVREGGGDGEDVCLVMAHTVVQGYVTSYDIVLNAYAHGRFDVSVNRVIARLDDLDGLEAPALMALLQQLRGFRGKLDAEAELRVVAPQIKAQIAEYEAAAHAAYRSVTGAGAGGAKKKPGVSSPASSPS